MQDKPDFESVLDKKLDDIKPPSAYPIGTYITLVDGPPTPGTAKTGTAYHEYAFRILAEGNKGDIDPAAMAKYVEDNGPIAGKIIRGQSCRFYLSGEAAFRYRDFLVNILGIEPGGKSLREGATEAPGKQLFITLRQVPAQDGSRMFHEVVGMARV